MKSPKSTGISKPFENLKTLLQSRSFCLKPQSPFSPQASTDYEYDPAADLALFKKAMADVKKIPRGKRAEKIAAKEKWAGTQNQTESEMVMQLENLLKTGAGFVVADTPEYIEGTGCRVHPQIAKRLHRGDFSIQGHIDLHGLSVEEARRVFEVFLKESITAGKRVVLVIHGRGLSSPAEPILKNNVSKWLTSGTWRKWVMAFSSARWCDGGAGATYVLLRQHPLTKRFRKRWKPK
jgi:DNA-nicking Smr family endonuclease